MLVTYARQDSPAFRRRADPSYWHPAYEDALEACAVPLRPLGEFIVHIAYGPIITGCRPPACAEGVALVNQGQIGPAGVDWDAALRVPEGCAWDRPTVRVQAEDLVFARSGVGSLMRNRVAIALGDTPAVVGSFVDLIRLGGLDPFYALLVLKSDFGWAQIHRLLNGVALPNVSFDEIRALLMPVAPVALQRECRCRYLQSVHPLHLSGAPAAGERLRVLAAWLAERLREGAT